MEGDRISYHESVRKAYDRIKSVLDTENSKPVISNITSSAWGRYASPLIAMKVNTLTTVNLMTNNSLYFQVLYKEAPISYCLGISSSHDQLIFASEKPFQVYCKNNINELTKKINGIT